MHLGVFEQKTQSFSNECGIFKQRHPPPSEENPDMRKFSGAIWMCPRFSEDFGVWETDKTEKT